MTSFDPPSEPHSMPTLYDDTHRGISIDDEVISSMATDPKRLGRLERHAPSTDGSFDICFANGTGGIGDLSQVRRPYLLLKNQ